MRFATYHEDDSLRVGVVEGDRLIPAVTEFLSDGDLVEVEIENIGALSNPCRTSRG